jgi:hypothetical protein
MSILPELLAQIVAISFCFHKKIKDTSVARLAPEKRNPSRQPLNKYRILSKKILLLSDTQLY